MSCQIKPKIAFMVWVFNESRNNNTRYKGYFVLRASFKAVPNGYPHVMSYSNDRLHGDTL